MDLSTEEQKATAKFLEQAGRWDGAGNSGLNAVAFALMTLARVIAVRTAQ